MQWCLWFPHLESQTLCLFRSLSFPRCWPSPQPCTTPSSTRWWTWRHPAHVSPAVKPSRKPRVLESQGKEFRIVELSKPLHVILPLVCLHHKHPLFWRIKLQCLSVFTCLPDRNKTIDYFFLLNRRLSDIVLLVFMSRQALHYFGLIEEHIATQRRSYWDMIQCNSVMFDILPPSVPSVWPPPSPSLLNTVCVLKPPWNILNFQRLSWPLEPSSVWLNRNATCSPYHQRTRATDCCCTS